MSTLIEPLKNPSAVKSGRSRSVLKVTFVNEKEDREYEHAYPDNESHEPLRYDPEEEYTGCYAQDATENYGLQGKGELFLQGEEHANGTLEQDNKYHHLLRLQQEREQRCNEHCGAESRDHAHGK